jgi:hypothetical protein
MRLGSAVAVVCAVAAAGCNFDPNTSQGDPTAQDDGGPSIDSGSSADSATVVTCDGESWWNQDFPKRRALTVEAAPFEYTMRLILDGGTVPTAQELVEQSELATGQDLRVVRFDGALWTELDRQILTFDAASVEIRFQIQEPTGFGGDSATYYLYYGNVSAAAELADLGKVYRRWHDFEADAVGSDGSPAFTPRPAGEWQVVDDGGNHVYRANGTNRLTAQLAGLDMEDGVFEAQMKVTAPDLLSANHNGLAIRADNFVPSELDFYVAQLRANEQVSAISTYRTGNFVTTGVTVPSTIVVAQWYRLRVEFAATSVDLYVDDTLVMSLTDAEQLRTGLWPLRLRLRGCLR